MRAAGLIFSNIHDRSIPEMTRVRTMASIPFGGRYRLIDFPLSNMVNSGVTKIGVITHYNYQSLLDHIGTGKDWDLARRSGGIKIIPPFLTAYGQRAVGDYSTRLEALIGASNFIDRCDEKYIVMADCDAICNIDLSLVLEDHIKNSADITFVTSKMKVGNMQGREKLAVVSTDESGNVTDFAYYTGREDEAEISTNIMIADRVYLQNVIAESAAHGYKSFYGDIISRSIGRARYRAYRFDGFFSIIGSLEGYFSSSMALLERDVRDELFNTENRPILTKVRNSAPTKYCSGAKITNSLVADGCMIEGEVENSIIFRGVKIGKGTKVKNSIILQDTYIGSDAYLNCVLTDKNVVIKDNRTLSGHQTMPFHIGKNIKV